VPFCSFFPLFSTIITQKINLRKLFPKYVA
jgi:hypothetical protein